MSTTDLTLSVVAVLGLMAWLRGCLRSVPTDRWLGLGLGLSACAIYFYLFTHTHIAWFAGLLLGTFLFTFLLFGRVLRSANHRALAVGLAVLAVAAAVAEHQIVSRGNALLVIEPYRIGTGWAFDAPGLGLKGEPFVQGIPEMIDKLVVGVPGAEKRVRLIFSQQRFPGAQLELDRRREEDGGNWYYSRVYQREGWLCPALFRYFPRAPQHIYVKAEPR